MHASRSALLLVAATLAVAAPAAAQRAPSGDLAISYIAAHANPVGPGGNFWLQGGSAELGSDLWRGLGVAANITGAHTASFGPSAIPLTLITVTVGPRYRYRPLPQRDISIYGEGLVGWGYGAGSIFPASGGVTDKASSLATHIGGGIDLGLSHTFAIRAIQASWIRTQLPNSTSNVQNNLTLGTGLVVRF